MDRAGTETWLMNVMRRIDRRQFRFDFLAHLPEPGEFDGEVRDLDGLVLRCPGPSNLTLYLRTLMGILRTHGPYDVVHSHVHRFSGFPLLVARAAGVPLRVAHSHTAAGVVSPAVSPPRKLYEMVSSRLIAAMATDRVACSRAAAEALFGVGASDVQVIPCGVDVSAFATPVDPASVKREFGIPEGAIVMGHVGRFVEAKNHRFLVEVLRRLAVYPRIHLLLIGDGPLRPEIEAQLTRAGLAPRVTFTGSRPDVARLMRAMDVFLFPSVIEGLGLVLVEAQAAGVRCVVSDGVPNAAAVVPGLVTVLPLASADTWAETTLQQLSTSSRAAWPDSLGAVERSPFSLDQSIRTLSRLYSKANITGARIGVVEKVR
jgi:glycosyltransferase involved in cell wall biosynthesis